MRITQMWKRDEPDTHSGYSITLTTVYSSQNKEEIDELEKKLPKGIMLMYRDRKEEGEMIRCK